jgi:GntR family transcriptional regulator
MVTIEKTLPGADMKNETQLIPKYHQIASEIIGKIKNGEFKTGLKIPSENEIIKSYQVSNTTARKALQEIEHEGWVNKIKGKGTYVREKNVTRAATKILSFTKNMLQMGKTPSTKVLESRIMRNNYSAVINGRKYTLKAPMLKIHRLRFADAVPMMLETRYISMKFCPRIDRKELSGSLYDIYEKEYGLGLREINQMLSADVIGSGFKEFFDLADPIPILRVEGVTFCGKEMILEMENSLYRGDKYRFAVTAF